ncbi:MAG TPA: glycine--tRNA ligase [Actinobacteria bacterium]|nr:glycine--tRNA ligase [Actinomycetota bacterium]
MAKRSDRMETLVSLSKRRGIVFPSSDIYGGLRASWDYGPLGVEIKNSIKRQWWRSMVQERDDIVGLDSSVILAPEVWQASGHLTEFADPLTECQSCHRRFRADHLEEAYEEKHGRPPEHGLADIACPNCGTRGAFTEPRMFNGMLRTYLGATEDESGLAYLRPETAQGIFINFRNVLQTSRKKVPFGIGQVGKSFRNEITPGNFIFRTREFEQMEMEFFCEPGTDERWFEQWRAERFRWYVEELGVRRSHLRLRDHEPSELAHYAKAATDVEYLYPFGWGELEGIANRTDFDLSAHQRASGVDLSYLDPVTGRSYIPYVIEPAAGVDRIMLTLLIDAFDEETVRGETRTVLRFHPDVAPVQVAVLPLSRKEELTVPARQLEHRLRPHFATDYDETQSIGRRYRRQDEIGTPLAVTFDFDSLQDDAVTIRERDGMTQVRVPVAGLEDALRDQLVAFRRRTAERSGAEGGRRGRP